MKKAFLVMVALLSMMCLILAGCGGNGGGNPGDGTGDNGGLNGGPSDNPGGTGGAGEGGGSSTGGEGASSAGGSVLYTVTVSDISGAGAVWTFTPVSGEASVTEFLTNSNAKIGTNSVSQYVDRQNGAWYIATNGAAWSTKDDANYSESAPFCFVAIAGENVITFSGNLNPSTSEISNLTTLKEPMAFTGIELSAADTQIGAGDTTKVTVKTVPYGIDVTADCSISVSEEFGSVADGVYTSLAEKTGTVTISASYDDGETKLTDTLEIEVVNKSDLPKFKVNLNTAVGGAWIYIDVFYTDSSYSVAVDNNSISNVVMENIGKTGSIGSASELSKGVRFGYEFESAAFQSGDHVLTFDIETETGSTYSLKVSFTGASGENKDMTISSVEITDKEIIP